MIAPFKFKKINNKILITNDLGKYYFLSNKEFLKYIDDKLEPNSDVYNELERCMFLYNCSKEEFVEQYKYYLRDMKNYLFGATALHIFVVTNYCNGKCVYCQANSNNRNVCKKLTKEMAKKAVDIALQSPQKVLDFEFQGGEPLSNFEIIKYIIDYTDKTKKNKEISYSIVTNLSLLDEKMIEYFKTKNITISTSLDGHSDLHDDNRPIMNGHSSYEIVSRSIEQLRTNGIKVGAIQTTTRNSLNGYKEIIDDYVNKGLEQIFIRPLTPLGCAYDKWDSIGYSAEEFVEFYSNSLRYIIELNKKNIFIKEGHASIFLSKILNGWGTNYMELRSPCGGTLGQMAYYYDGKIFTCDEGRMLYEMGDESFCIGDVNKSYNELLESSASKVVCKKSILEGIPNCSDCAFQPYCGVCPVVNYALEKDVVSKKHRNYRCKINEGILTSIFNLINDNDENVKIMRRWIQ